MEHLANRRRWSSSAAAGQDDLWKADVGGIAAKESKGKGQTKGKGKLLWSKAKQVMEVDVDEWNNNSDWQRQPFVMGVRCTHTSGYSTSPNTRAVSSPRTNH